MISRFRTAGLLSLLLGFVACQTPQSTMAPAGPASGRINPLQWVVLILFCVIAFIMWVLLAWVATRRRGTLDFHEPWDVGGGQSWVLIGGFTIPFIVLFFLFVFGLENMAGFPVHDGMVKPEIRVVGHQWWWEIDYIGGRADQQFITANEIHIPVGRPVDIELATRDVIHSFWVPKLHGKVDLIPGQSNYIRIEADQPGIYHGECAEYCGQQHAHMMLLVVADNPDEYAAWIDQQLKPATQPTTAEALHGRDVFMSGACILCHTIRGTEAHGAVAPDLTHLASRAGIAAESYDNNIANLEAWVTHAQSLKPGSEMPDLTEFTGTDLRALVTYLRELQ